MGNSSSKQLLEGAAIGDVDKVKSALKDGADVNCVDILHFKKTPLHKAAYGGHRNVLEVLIDWKANIDSVDEQGYTPLHDASSRGHFLIVFKLLVAGANKDISNNLGNTPLHNASYNGHYGVVDTLLRLGASKNVSNNNGNTPLHDSADNGHIGVVMLLLEAGVNNSIANKFGYTPLHKAAYSGHTDVVKLLLYAGARKNIIDNVGNTPLDRARERGHAEIVELLETSANVAVTDSFNEEDPGELEFGIAVADTKLKWNIDNFNEEQVFEKPEYGVKLVVPPLSVKDNQSIDTTVEIVKSDYVTLPPNVEPVSCFYKIGTSGSFVNAIHLHLQHSVDLTSCDNKILAFVTSSGSPPYQFEFCDASDQMFDQNDNSGVVRISHFSTHVFGIVWRKVVDILGKVFIPKRSYAMTPFFKQIDDHCWHVQIVVTHNLGPFFEKLKTLYYEWNKRDSGSFYFNSSTITMNEHSEVFNITSLKSPSKIEKEDVDKCSVDSIALPILHYEVELKPNSFVTNLKLEFMGTSEEVTSIVITKRELCSGKFGVVSEIKLSNELLAKAPMKKHLVSQLNPIKHQWLAIGEQLDVEDGPLKSIKYDATYNDTNRLSEVFQIWSDGMTTEVSWRKILDVIKNPPIDNRRLELEIQQFLSRPDIQHIYLSSVNKLMHQQTFPMPKPLDLEKGPIVALLKPKPVPRVVPKQNVKDQPSLDQIKIAARQLHQETKQWEDKNNSMIAAATNMADYMIKMSEFQVDNEDVKEDFIQTVHLIVHESEVIVKMANKVCNAAIDHKGLKKTLVQVIEAIPTISNQLKILVGVTARQSDDESNRESMEMLIDNAQNLMTKVSEVLHATETVMIYNVPPEIRTTFTDLNWVKRY